MSIHTYNSDSIQSLGILGGVRAKPASIGLENHNHTFIEILANAIDEHREGYGNEIIITKWLDRSISVQDYGRSVPMDKNSEGEYAYKKVFDELWSGGKYNNNESDGQYQFSLGTNGVGATGTNYTSDFFECKAINSNGYVYSIRYEKGIQVGELVKKRHHLDYHGTIIHWLPSTEVFRGEQEIETDFIKETLKNQAIVNQGLKFTFINQISNEEEIYYYEKGVIDYIEEVSRGNHFTEIMQLKAETKGKEKNEETPFKFKAEISFVFNREIQYMKYFHNSSLLEHGGTPETYIKQGFTKAIDHLLKDRYTKGEKRVTFEDVRDSLIVISNSYSTISLYTDQTKKKMESKFVQEYMTQFLREKLEVYFVENPLEAQKIAEQILINKRSREKAERTRLDVKRKLQSSVNNITNRIDGFINCKSKDNSQTELYIVEGKSALGSTKQGRNAEFQAIYALRGKILNCLKADYDKIFKNDIIVDLIKLLGCGIEIKSKYNKDLHTFDLDKLRWSKVIITTDADIDGFHIRTLLLTVLYRLVPSLIESGKIYIAESPLYEITQKDQTFFAYTDKEKEAIVKNSKGKVTIQRSKGLGENTAEMMWETTMNPETRKLVQIVKEDVERTQHYFELFLGDDLQGRKQYIEENLHAYIEAGLES
ncbi:DNA gyrase subunit B [Seinonella peptonophila]|uniref:DNA topoisomerase (ATP-hydrolyzing) n=1 Tax=Seinonella peptonophila TaxID=112248 RepID=A0A1M5BB25_9BACL|nr:toprim domain-containing protein [Seinonella peptonophila]SHF39382.1 DNA gyrase subunit B [Seinonella peptonophila]